ncbi:hypothetical protein [Streptomyces sp. MUM 203J]|uniref:hypothetical protein n=1 Tax=Streptomyces sp. MUM 203J TaxID=2791990 RepID=UPI001F03BBFA|nr:hypothetical protein [Streptomyces sp. MUM 203J]
MAVFGIVLIALTGARGSGGGSCSGSSHGSGGGSDHGSSGNHGSDGGGVGKSDTDDGTSSASGGSGSGGGVVPGGSSNAALRDIRIDECKMDPASKKLVARLTVTNDGALDYAYDFTVRFQGAAGESVTRAVARVDDLAVEGGATRTAEASTAYPGTGDGSEYKRCTVAKASRTLT